jgi:pSer/pThr/pTyr-binding forkhead associated (FHA) protein
LYKDDQNRARLCILYGEPKGAVFLLRQRNNTIGRDGGNIIVLGDEQISNKHAAINFAEDSYWIEDSNSKNGVYVNGVKIVKRERLVDRSLIKLGSTILRFEANSRNSLY